MTTSTAVRATTAVRNLESLALVGRKKAEAVTPEAFVPGLGNVDVATAIVPAPPTGSSAVLLTITGFSFSTPTPFMVLIHPRQNPADDNVDNGFPDQFATQVISTDFNSMLVRITRIDPDAEGQAWGQDLELDIFVVE